ncbi:MAG: ABC transporter ATP-binding protein [Myxococcaceae bacterium]
MTELAIDCRGLKKRYGEVQAVDGLDLQVRRGECFGLLGPNGAGKTTTVEILEGLSAPDEGSVEVLGHRWANDATWLRERLGITLQETHLPDRLSVAEVVRLFRSFFQQGCKVDEVIALVELGEKRDAWYEKLSGGQKQRLAVACALVGNPELLFLDEPTTGLDPQSRRGLWDVVLGLKAEGRTVLLTTHYMDEAERLCDRVAIVDRGRVISLGTPRELISRHVGQEVVEFVTAPELDEAALGKLAGVQSVRRVAGAFALTVDRVHVALPALLALVEGGGAKLSRLSTHSATLDDVFVALTGKQLRE